MSKLVGISTAILCFASLSACSPESEGRWLMGAGYHWTGLNHRLSYLHAGVTENTVEVAVIGGTSTTGLVTTFPDDCDFSVCQELPVKDSAEVWVQWGHLRTRKGTIGATQAEIVIDQTSQTIEVEIPLSRTAKGTPSVVLTSLSIDTDEGLSGGVSCYDPFNGWHPKQMSLALGEPTLAETRDRVTIPLTGVFEAGESLEDIRECVDAVNDQARVHVTAGLLAVVTPGDVLSQSVEQTMTYSYGSKFDPDPQDDPDWSQRSLELPSEDHLIGWTSMSYTFHQEDPEGRGAYIRSLEFGIDVAGNRLFGHATNYSPGTQITGFDYRFEGTVVAVPISGEVSTGVQTLEVPADVNSDREPIIHSVGI